MDSDFIDIEFNDKSDSPLYDSYDDSNNIYGVQLHSSEMVRSSSSDIDYTGYFDDIINRFETMIAYDSSDGSAVTLETIHHDLGIIITILLVFVAVFVGHGFVSKFRNL